MKKIKNWFRKMALRYLLWAEHFMFKRNYTANSPNLLFGYDKYAANCEQLRNELKKLD